MYIKLLCILPVSPQHGMTEGRILKVVKKVEKGKARTDPSAPKWYVKGDVGERVGVLPHEATEVDEPTATADELTDE